MASFEQTKGLPISLREMAAEVRFEGGSQALYEMYEQVQQASEKNLEILEDAFNALDEEQEEDEALRGLYQDSKYFIACSYRMLDCMLTLVTLHRMEPARVKCFYGPVCSSRSATSIYAHCCSECR